MFDIHIHNGSRKIVKLLTNLTIKINQIMSTQKEIAEKLTALQAETEKVAAEVKAKLDELAEAIKNQGNASPEVETALANLTTAVAAVDDLIPDSPPPATPGS